MDATNPTPLPALFVSHGSPMIAIEPSPTADFLRALGPAIDRRFGRPRAVLAVSPHTAARTPLLLAAERHAAVHDFGGFAAALHALRYDAPGAPALAGRVRALAAAAGIAVDATPQGGLDHGIWTVLHHLWPAADVPVLPLALVPDAAPAAQWALGAALAPLLADGVLLLASGSLTHDLRRFFGAGPRAALDAPAAPDVAAFQDWVAGRVDAGDRAALLDYRSRAPHAAALHPTDEHWLPFYVAAGAGGLAGARRLHGAVQHGVLAMDAYAFGAGAAALADALEALANVPNARPA